MITEIKSISTIIDTPSAYDHYLQVNTGLKPEDSICKSLEKYGINLIQDLLVMIRDYIEVVEYINKSGSLKPLHCGGQGCVKVIHAFLDTLGMRELMTSYLSRMTTSIYIAWICMIPIPYQLCRLQNQRNLQHSQHLSLLNNLRRKSSRINPTTPP